MAKQCYPVTAGRRLSLGRCDPGGGWAVVFEIRQFGDPVLRSKAAPDALFDDFLRRLTEGMLNTLRAGGQRSPPIRSAVSSAVRCGDRRRGVCARQPAHRRDNAGDDDRYRDCLSSITGIGVEAERCQGVVVSGQDAEGRPLRFEVTGRIHDAARDGPPRRSTGAEPHGPVGAQAGRATAARTPAGEQLSLIASSAR